MQKGTTVHVQDGTVSTGVTYSFQAIDPVIGTDDTSLVFYLSGDVLGDVAAAASGATEAAVAAAAASAAAAAASAAAAAASVDAVETLLDGYSVLSIGTVTTLPAGEDATVTNVGTPGKVTLDLPFRWVKQALQARELAMLLDRLQPRTTALSSSMERPASC